MTDRADLERDLERALERATQRAADDALLLLDVHKGPPGLWGWLKDHHPEAALQHWLEIAEDDEGA